MFNDQYLLKKQDLFSCKIIWSFFEQFHFLCSIFAPKHLIGSPPRIKYFSTYWSCFSKLLQWSVTWDSGRLKFNHLLNHPLSHLLTYWLTHSLTHSIPTTYPPNQNYLLTYLFTNLTILPTNHPPRKGSKGHFEYPARYCRMI